MGKIELVEKTYSTSEVIEICKIPRSTLTRYRAEGKIPCEEVGRGMRYPASWVEEWRIPEDHVKLSEYAKRYGISRQTVHAWIGAGRVEAKQGFTGLWWVRDIGTLEIPEEIRGEVAEEVGRLEG